MGFLSAIASGAKWLLGIEGTGQTATKIIEKVAGTDWTPQQQSEFILKYVEASKYQSPTRRFLAVMFALEQAVFATTWLVSMLYGRLAMDSQAILIKADIETFMASNISMAINSILAFYFLIGMKK